jgi:hypothetical protein
MTATETALTAPTEGGDDGPKIITMSGYSEYCVG